MRRIARAKASKMARPASATPMQPLDHISEEERAEILKFVETEQTQVTFLSLYTLRFYIPCSFIRVK